jgi:hypothetical protein
MENQEAPEQNPKRGLSVRVKKIISVVVIAILILWVFAIGYSIWRANSDLSVEYLESASGITIETTYQCVLHWELYIETRRELPSQLHIENLERLIRERGLAVIPNFEAGSTQEMLFICEGRLEDMWSLLPGVEQATYPNVTEFLFYPERLEEELRDYNP